MTPKTIIPIELLDLRENGFHPIIKGKINGKVARFVLDTGASRSVLDRNYIDHYKINGAYLTNEIMVASHDFNGKDIQKLYSKIVEKIQFSDVLIVGFDMLMTDLSNINHCYFEMGFKPVQGMIGSDILNNYEAQINYKKKELTLFW